MITLVRVTDPQQARALYGLGLLRYGKKLMCDHSWASAYTATSIGNPNYLEDVVKAGRQSFYVQVED